MRYLGSRLNSVFNNDLTSALFLSSKVKFVVDAASSAVLPLYTCLAYKFLVNVIGVTGLVLAPDVKMSVEMSSSIVPDVIADL